MNLSGFSNAGIEKTDTGNQRRNEARRPASAPLPEHRFGRDTVLAASHRGICQTRLEKGTSAESTRAIRKRNVRRSGMARQAIGRRLAPSSNSLGFQVQHAASYCYALFRL